MFRKQYAYRTESPEVKKQGRIYAFGVPAITALPDGRLLVLEREFYVSEGYIGSWVKNKLFVVNPAEATPITASTDLASLPDSDFLQKQLLTTFTTSLKLKTRDLANYEGMCLGPKLEDGRQTLLLISDAQGGFGNSLYKMKDFLQVLLLDNLGD